MKRRRTLVATFLAIALSTELQAQTIGGPILGFVADASRETVSPVLGIPGASMLGSPLTLSGSAEALAVSPRQDFALGIQREDGTARVVRIDLRTAGFPASPVPGGDQYGNSLLAISPSGTAAAVFDSATQRVQIISGLPRSAWVDAEIDVAPVSGDVTALSVSDDGLVALLKSADSMWAVSRSGFPWQVPASNPGAAAFLPQRRDAVITDDETRSALLIRDIGQSNSLAVLSFAGDNETFRAAAASEDGRTVFLAGDSGNIQIVDVFSGSVTSVSCGCSPTVLERMNGTSVFRLTEPGAEAMAMLDASKNEPRILLILPPATD